MDIFLAVEHFSLTVGGAAIKEHRLAKGGFSLAAVPDDRNVADIFSCDTHIKSPPCNEILKFVIRNR